ncbi:MAG: NUDIX hydrolase [Pseudomonadota bacterium]
MSADGSQIRDAATVIVMRPIAGVRHVLMGQRGAKAAFMPSKFVFPGGAVDAGDRAIALEKPVPDRCATRLNAQSEAGLGHALAVAAIRELWEETGLALGAPGPWEDPPHDWVEFARLGLRPDARALRFVFRAITPPGRPRRFDARFFLLPAEALTGDLDDFSRASDELSHLQWIEIKAARQLDLPFITEVVLAELDAADPLVAPASVPFFRNDDEESIFLRLRG